MAVAVGGAASGVCGWRAKPATPAACAVYRPPTPASPPRAANAAAVVPVTVLPLAVSATPLKAATEAATESEDEKENTQ